MAVNIKHLSTDAFGFISDERIKLGIQEIVSGYHWRDGKEHADGSRGTIKISPKEFRDLLAYMSGATDPATQDAPDQENIGEYNEEDFNSSINLSADDR